MSVATERSSGPPLPLRKYKSKLRRGAGYHMMITFNGKARSRTWISSFLGMYHTVALTKMKYREEWLWPEEVLQLIRWPSWKKFIHGSKFKCRSLVSYTLNSRSLGTVIFLGQIFESYVLVPPGLLRCNWWIRLCTVKGYNLMVWYTYTWWDDHHSQVEEHIVLVKGHTGSH